MTGKDIEKQLVTAILNRDLSRIGELIDALRFQGKLTYSQIAALARGITGITNADWDELLYEVDSIDTLDRN